MTTVRAVRPLAILMVLGALLPWTGKAEAMNRDSIGTISPDNPVIEKSYPPIAGIYPNARAPLDDETCSQLPRCGAEPFANFKPEMCRNANWCDTHSLDIDYPDGYIYDVFFGVLVTLTWENPRTRENPNGDDLDMFLWADDDPTSGAPTSECGSPGTPDCDFLYPEIIAMTEPEDTIEPEGTDEGDQLPAKLFTVVNHIGLNTGYTIRVEWFTFDVEFGDFFRPKRSGGPSVGSGGDPAGTPAGFDPTSLRGVQGPKANRKILIPGTDGEFVEMQLPLLAAGKVLDPPDEEGGLNPIVIAGSGIGAVGLALGTVTVIRRRRLSRGGF